jgi:hypothetical protein
MPYHTNSKSKMSKSKSKNIMTLAQAKEKFDKMKNKPKPLNKVIGKLKPLQSKLMKDVKGHSKLHLSFMRYLMKDKGYCFEQSHKLTMKIVGK